MGKASRTKVDATRREKIAAQRAAERDRKSTRLNSSHSQISYAVFCLKKKTPAACRPTDARRCGSAASTDPASMGRAEYPPRRRPAPPRVRAKSDQPSQRA